MTELKADYKALADYRPAHKVRFVTAAALFDGHDAAINIMRRILQSKGVEVIHLGHNRSVHEIAEAAIEEDVQAIAITPTTATKKKSLPLWRRRHNWDADFASCAQSAGCRSRTRQRLRIYRRPFCPMSRQARATSRSFDCGASPKHMASA
jgi:hypothetical protein